MADYIGQEQRPISGRKKEKKKLNKNIHILGDCTRIPGSGPVEHKMLFHRTVNDKNGPRVYVCTCINEKAPQNG